MAWQETPYTILLITAAVISASSALYVWLRQPVPGSKTMTLIALAGAEWMVGYALELGSVDLLTKDFWNKTQYVGIVTVLTAWLVFTLQYTGCEKWLTRRTLLLLSIDPLLTLLLVFTNEVHGLIWGPAALETSGPFLVLVRTHGVGYWIHAAYTYTLLLTVVFLLIQMLIRSRHLYRRQASLLLFAASLPMLGNVLMLSGLNPLPHLDLTPIAFTIAGLILTWGFFRLRVGDIVPVARGVVIESMSDGVIVLDEQNRIVDINPVAQHAIGYTASETIGQFVEQMWPDWPGLIERSSDGTGTSEEVVLSTGDAQYTYDVRLSPIVDWRGRLTSQVIVLRDVTERKRAKQALQRYIERLRILRAIDGVILAAWSPEEIAQAALRHIRRLVPCWRASVMIFESEGQGVTVLAAHVDGETRVGTGARFSLEEIEDLATLRQGKVRVIEDVRTLSPLSAVIQALQSEGLRSYVSMPLISHGELIGSLQLAKDSPGAFAPEHIDIAHEVAAQVALALHQARLRAALEAEQQRLEALVEHMPEGVLLLDEERRLVLSNPAAETYLLALTDAAGPSAGRVGNVLAHLADRPVEELLQSPPERLWHELEVAGTPSHVFEVAAQPISAKARIGGWVMLIRDVTEEREVQQRVQQQERLAAVGESAAGIAHDFNNIIAAIILHSQLLLRTPDLPSKSRERLMTISQQAQQAASLIGQILDFSRRSVLERQPLDLVLLFDEFVKLLRLTLPENIRLELEYEPDGCVVNADPTRMQQVLMNLALNARDAMPEGGELRIRLQQIRIQPGEALPLPEMEAAGTAAREWVGVTVSDTGTGMPPDVLPRIYEPFFTTKAPGEGSGLGLAQVYGIVTQHEGYIDVKSRVGHGTIFTFYLPALPASQMEPLAPETETLTEGRGETILVVEDDPAVRTALSAALEMLNYRVLVATNGQEAMAIFEQHAEELALVVSDMVMPGMSGKKLMRELRMADPYLKALAITGYALADDVQELRENGILEVVQKPFEVDTLAQAIRRVLDAD